MGRAVDIDCKVSGSHLCREAESRWWRGKKQSPRLLMPGHWWGIPNNHGWPGTTVGKEGRGSQEVKSPSVFWSPLCPHESPPSTGIAHGGPAGTGKKEEKELCWLGLCPSGVEEWETAWCSAIHSAWGSLLGCQAWSSVLGSLMHSGGPLSWAESRPYLPPPSRVFSGGMGPEPRPHPLPKPCLHLNSATT